MSTACQAATAISGHLDTRTAAMEVADRLYDEIGGECDLLLVFTSYHHRAAYPESLEHLRKVLTPHRVLGTTAESVLGEDEERDGRAGFSALALKMPGVSITPWCSASQPQWDPNNPEQVRNALGITDNVSAILMFADPFTFPANPLLTSLESLENTPPVIGGLASGASQPGHNALAMDNLVLTGGAVGVTLENVDVSCIVSQGCRPIGEPVIITSVKGNLVQQLAGKPAMAVLKEATLQLGEEDRQLLNQGLMLGTAVNEHKARLGRGDFLLRNITGLDTKSGAVAVGDRVRAGQKVQFHIRDEATATEDLQLLLDGQQLKEPPFGAMLVTCNSRGTRLFSEPNHDLAALRDRLNVPVAGFFAAGEIGPIGDRSFLHGHTASVAVFR